MEQKTMAELQEWEKGVESRLATMLKEGIDGIKSLLQEHHASNGREHERMWKEIDNVRVNQKDIYEKMSDMKVEPGKQAQENNRQIIRSVIMLLIGAALSALFLILSGGVFSG